MSAAADLRDLAAGMRESCAERHEIVARWADAAEEIALRVEALEARAVPPGDRAGGDIPHLADARQRDAVSRWMERRGPIVIDGGQL